MSVHIFRNYQRLFGNATPRMTLNQWQSKNNSTHKRFSKVTNIFERSQVSLTS